MKFLRKKNVLNAKKIILGDFQDFGCVNSFDKNCIRCDDIMDMDVCTQCEEGYEIDEFGECSEIEN